MRWCDDPYFSDWVLKTMRSLGFSGTRMDIGSAEKLVPTYVEGRMDACQGGFAKKDLAKTRLESMTYADWVLFDGMDTEKHAVH